MRVVDEDDVTFSLSWHEVTTPFCVAFNLCIKHLRRDKSINTWINITTLPSFCSWPSSPCDATWHAHHSQGYGCHSVYACDDCHDNLVVVSTLYHNQLNAQWDRSNESWSLSTIFSTARRTLHLWARSKWRRCISCERTRELCCLILRAQYASWIGLTESLIISLHRYFLEKQLFTLINFYTVIISTILVPCEAWIVLIIIVKKSISFCVHSTEWCADLQQRVKQLTIQLKVWPMKHTD